MLINKQIMKPIPRLNCACSEMLNILKISLVSSFFIDFGDPLKISRDSIVAALHFAMLKFTLVNIVFAKFKVLI